MALGEMASWRRGGDRSPGVWSDHRASSRIIRIRGRGAAADLSVSGGKHDCRRYGDRAERCWRYGTGRAPSWPNLPSARNEPDTLLLFSVFLGARALAKRHRVGAQPFPGGGDVGVAPAFAQLFIPFFHSRLVQRIVRMHRLFESPELLFGLLFFGR
jgi:hypothetical protein